MTKKQLYDENGNPVKKGGILKKLLFVGIIVIALSAIFGGGDKKDESSTTASNNTAQQPVAEPTKEETKEQPKEEVKEGPKEEVKEEPKEQPKEETKEQPKEQPKEETKEQPKEQPKVENELVVGDANIKVIKSQEKKVLKSNNQFINDAKTKGKFVRLDVEITNTGDKAKLFNNSAFKLIDDQGREFETTNNMDVMTIIDNDVFLREINPDMSIEGTLIFEVPSDVESYSLKYSELFSDGEIKLK